MNQNPYLLWAKKIRILAFFGENSEIRSAVAERIKARYHGLRYAQSQGPCETSCWGSRRTATELRIPQILESHGLKCIIHKVSFCGDEILLTVTKL